MGIRGRCVGRGYWFFSPRLGNPPGSWNSGNIEGKVLNYAQHKKVPLAVAREELFEEALKDLFKNNCISLDADTRCSFLDRFPRASWPVIVANIHG